MKKLYFLLFAFCTFSINAQIINIPDAGFKTYLLSSGQQQYIALDSSDDQIMIDANGNNEIEMSEAMQVYSLIVTGNTGINFSSVEGINGFKNLRNLMFNFTEVPSIDLRDFLFLTKVSVYNTRVLCTMNLNNLPQLYEFDCNNYSGTTTRLTSLNMSGVEQLAVLRCNSNYLTSLDINNCTNLQYVEIQNNYLTDVNISNLQALSYIDLSWNEITNLSLPTSMPSLYKIDVSHNQLASLSLSNCPFLNWAIANTNQLTSLSLVSCPALTSLTVSENLLTSLNLSALQILSQLNCGHNLLNTLILPDTPSLRHLDCSYNQLTSLTFYPAYADLWEVICRNNRLETLNVEYLTTLYDLDCRTNALRSLFVKNNFWENLQFLGNPDLAFICVDPSQQSQVQQLANANALGTLVSTDCSDIVLNSEAFSSIDDLRIYPNPVSNVLYFDRLEDTKITSIEIYNTLGQLTYIVAGTNQSIEVSGLKTGTYFIKIISDKGTTNSKFVKL